MSQFTLLQEQIIRFSDLILLSHSILQQMNKSYGVYVTEYCFNTLLQKIKKDIKKVVINCPRQRNLPDYERFELDCLSKYNQFESKELNLIQGDTSAFAHSFSKLQSMMRKFENVQKKYFKSKDGNTHLNLVTKNLDRNIEQ